MNGMTKEKNEQNIYSFLFPVLINLIDRKRKEFKKMYFFSQSISWIFKLD